MSIRRTCRLSALIATALLALAAGLPAAAQAQTPITDFAPAGSTLTGCGQALLQPYISGTIAVGGRGYVDIKVDTDRGAPAHPQFSSASIAFYEGGSAQPSSTVTLPPAALAQLDRYVGFDDDVTVKYTVPNLGTNKIVATWTQAADGVPSETCTLTAPEQVIKGVLPTFKIDAFDDVGKLEDTSTADCDRTVASPPVTVIVAAHGRRATFRRTEGGCAGFEGRTRVVGAVRVSFGDDLMDFKPAANGRAQISVRVGSRVLLRRTAVVTTWHQPGSRVYALDNYDEYEYDCENLRQIYRSSHGPYCYVPGTSGRAIKFIR